MLTDHTMKAISEGQKDVERHREFLEISNALALWHDAPQLLASKTTARGSKQFKVTPAGAYVVILNTECVFIGVDHEAAIRAYLNA